MIIRLYDCGGCGQQEIRATGDITVAPPCPVCGAAMAPGTVLSVRPIDPRVAPPPAPRDSKPKRGAGGPL